MVAGGLCAAMCGAVPCRAVAVVLAAAALAPCMRDVMRSQQGSSCSVALVLGGGNCMHLTHTHSHTHTHWHRHKAMRIGAQRAGHNLACVGEYKCVWAIRICTCASSRSHAAHAS